MNEAREQRYCLFHSDRKASGHPLKAVKKGCDTRGVKIAAINGQAGALVGIHLFFNATSEN